MSQSRANLLALDTPAASTDGLAAARQPLATRPPKFGPQAVKPDDDAVFASLEAPAREPMVSFTLRLPLSMATDVEEICARRKVDKSALVRDFIILGLRKLAAAPPQR